MISRDESRYLPVLLRALELGDGPPGLDRWVCQRVYTWSVEDPSLALRLASELRTLMVQPARDRLLSQPGEFTDNETLVGRSMDRALAEGTIEDGSEK